MVFSPLFSIISTNYRFKAVKSEFESSTSCWRFYFLYYNKMWLNEMIFLIDENRIKAGTLEVNCLVSWQIAIN